MGCGEARPAAASGAFAGCGHPCGFGNGHCAGKGAALFKNGRRRRLFVATVCGDEVAHAKPAPDIFLAAAKALGVPAEECLVLEDSPNGLRAARAAGCKAVVVPDITPIPPESEGLWAARAATLADVIPLLECL